MTAAQLAPRLAAITHFQDQLEELGELAQQLDGLRDPALVPAILGLFERHGEEEDFGLFHSLSSYIEQFSGDAVVGDSTVAALVVASVRRAPRWITQELVGCFVSEEEAEALAQALREAEAQEEAEAMAEDAEGAEDEEEEELSATDPATWARHPPRDGVLHLGSVSAEQIEELIGRREQLPQAILQLQPPKEPEAVARLGELGRPLWLPLSDTWDACFAAALTLGPALAGLEWRDRDDRLDEAMLARIGEIDTLRYVDLHPKVPTGAFAAWMARLPELRHLRLYERQHLPGLAALPHPERLERLDASELRGGGFAGQGELGPEDLAPLSRLSGLRELRLSLNHLTGDALGSLSGLGELRTLWLGGMTWNKAPLGFLRGLPALEWLILDVGPLNAAGAEALGTLGRLRRLELYRTGLGAAGVAALARLEALEELSVQSSALTDADLARLGGLRRLRSLCTSSAKISDASVPTLAGLPALRELRLDSAALTDAGLEALCRDSRLQKLELTRCKGLSDDAIASLQGLRWLELLNLGGTKISKRARKAFEKARPRVFLQDYTG